MSSGRQDQKIGQFQLGVYPGIYLITIVTIRPVAFLRILPRQNFAGKGDFWRHASCRRVVPINYVAATGSTGTVAITSDPSSPARCLEFYDRRRQLAPGGRISL